MSQCKGVTKDGELCKNFCWKRKDNNYCKSHQIQCADFYKEYKNVCDRVWDLECLDDMTLEELELIKKMSDLCAKGRRNFQQKCVPDSEKDRGHFQAILRMYDKIDKCAQIERKKKAKK